MTNNFAFEVKVYLCLKYTFTGGGGGGGGGWLDKPMIMLISAPVGFELGLGAELGNKNYRDRKIDPSEHSELNMYLWFTLPLSTRDMEIF